jgi:Ca2+-binding RTX toxin-like protein
VADFRTAVLSIDWLSYSDSNAAVTVSLGGGANSGGHAAGDTITGIEKLYGSNFGDGLRGDANDNQIYGNGGGDVLNGRGGADLLVGGAGDDIFEFTASASSSVDTISDFVNDADTLRITMSAYANVGASANDLLTNHTTVVGTDVHIALDANNTIVVKDFLIANGILDLADDILLI